LGVGVGGARDLASFYSGPIVTTSFRESLIPPLQPDIKSQASPLIRPEYKLARSLAPPALPPKLGMTPPSEVPEDLGDAVTVV